jgi:hypothetical protein
VLQVAVWRGGVLQVLLSKCRRSCCCCRVLLLSMLSSATECYPSAVQAWRKVLPMRGEAIHHVYVLHCFGRRDFSSSTQISARQVCNSVQWFWRCKHAFPCNYFGSRIAQRKFWISPPHTLLRVIILVAKIHICHWDLIPFLCNSSINTVIFFQ